MTAEQRLAAFLAEAPVAEREPAFSVAVMRRVARRAFTLTAAFVLFTMGLEPGRAGT